MGIANLLGLDIIAEDLAAMRQDIADDLRGIGYQAIRRTPPPPSHYMPVKLRAAIIQRDGHRCRYCGMHGEAERGPDGEPWHIDHVYPLGRGGKTTPRNLVLSCAACNLEKGDRLRLPRY
jgi:5-methylcytosine-specific restriction endonuclease McrA